MEIITIRQYEGLNGNMWIRTLRTRRQGAIRYY
jgi:hypothetical protein